MIQLIAGNISVQHLLALCHQKNELNRRRRRFYNLMSFGYRNATRLARGEKGLGVCHIDSPSARKGYEQAKADMKAMTANMRSIRETMRAKFVWSDHGAISACIVDGRVINHKDFKKHYEAEMFETTVLGG